MPKAESAVKKYCRACHGFCPSGVLDNELCLDCDANRSPEAEAKRAFARALAERSPFWRALVRQHGVLGVPP